MTLKLTTYYKGSNIPPLPGKDTFHSTTLFQIYESTPGYKPVLVVASEQNRPVAKLLGVIRDNGRRFLLQNIKQCEIFDCGEYFDNNIDKELVFNEMLQRITDDALRDCFLIEFRNLREPIFGYKTFRNNHYFSVNWLRVRNSLHGLQHTEERFSASRIRQIKKGLKNGAEVREAHSATDIQAFAQMIRRNYSSKIRRHLPARELFQNLENEMMQGDNSRIFIVTYKGKIIGGSACIYSEKDAYLWFSGGMRKTYALLYPGILAVWKAIDDARQRGYEHLEFMDVGLPFRHHGYREFVLRFGGLQSSSRRWFRVRWEWLNRLFEKIYS